MLKKVRFDKRAVKEIKKFPVPVQAKIKARVKVLSRDGNLEEPFAKRLNKELFEIRVRYKGRWRVIYAYLIEDYVVVLSAFQKKTQKTPKRELEKAKLRLERYKL